MPQPISKRLLVAIHDVGPRFEREVDILRAHLSRHVPFAKIAMLVVPNHWGEAPLITGSRFACLAAPISDRVTFATMSASADALIHGCEAETFCMIAAEAKASGLPMIVPHCGGTADQFTVGHGETYAACDTDACHEPF